MAARPPLRIALNVAIDGALAAQALEQRVRRALDPVLALGDQDVFDRRGVGSGHGRDDDAALTPCQP